MPKRTVLVVDDELPVRGTLTKFFKSIGVEEVLEAGNGEEALARIQEAPHLKLVLMDLKMPLKDGIQTLKEIRQINPAVKVVVLTGYPFYEGADQTLPKGGAFEFLVKPVDLDYLERVVNLVFSS